MSPRKSPRKSAPPEPSDDTVDIKFPPGAIVNHISDPEDEAPGVVLSCVVHIDGAIDYVVEWSREAVGTYKGTMLRMGKY